MPAEILDVDNINNLLEVRRIANQETLYFGTCDFGITESSET